MITTTPDNHTDTKWKIAYIHRTSFPSPEANTFDSIWSASALADAIDTTFFVPRLKTTKTRLREFYEIPNSRLKIQSMHLNLIPDRVLLKIPGYYERSIYNFLRFHPAWFCFNGVKILYVRETKELLFWGLNRERFRWMKHWVFCYEAHDTLGLDPRLFFDAITRVTTDRMPTEIEKRTLKAAKKFDLMICNMQTLADDMKAWSKNTLQPKVLTLASPLPRISNPPRISFQEKIVVGYIGTIDKLRGVDILFEAMRHLPENFQLRIVGRIRKEPGIDPTWVESYLSDPEINSKLDVNIVTQIDNVAAEIDRCDILIQPASKDLFDERYTAPLKSYSYLVRGKPIVAGDSVSHRELFGDDNSALLYQLTPEDLADKILYLVNNPDIANKIAHNAWKQGEYYSFSRKVNDFVGMVDTVLIDRASARSGS